MVAVSLNVGGGVRLIKPAKLFMGTQNTTNTRTDGLTELGVCGNGSVRLSHSGNVVTRIGIHTHTHFYQSFTMVVENRFEKVLSAHEVQKGPTA